MPDDEDDLDPERLLSSGRDASDAYTDPLDGPEFRSSRDYDDVLEEVTVDTSDLDVPFEVEAGSVSGVFFEFARELRRPPELDRYTVDFYSSGVPAPTVDEIDGSEPPSYEEEEHRIMTDVETAEAILDRIGQEIEQREKQGHRVDHLVLGIPQYRKLTAWAHGKYNSPVEDVVPVDEVTVVPGPMIHAAIPNKDLLLEKEAEDD